MYLTYIFSKFKELNEYLKAIQVTDIVINKQLLLFSFIFC